MDRFDEERNRALDEIHAAVSARMKQNVERTRAFMKGKKRLRLPEHQRIHETFRWPIALLRAAEELKAGRPLKETFARVSPRYRMEDPDQALGLSDDFLYSPAARTDGRRSAFEDMLRILSVAERDLDLEWRPVPEQTIAFWRRRYPLDPPRLELAHRSNQRRYSKESLREMRCFLEDLQAGRKAGPAHGPPKP
jgi:hypothetical protein